MDELRYWITTWHQTKQTNKKQLYLSRLVPNKWSFDATRRWAKPLVLLRDCAQSRLRLFTLLHSGKRLCSIQTRSARFLQRLPPPGSRTVTLLLKAPPPIPQNKSADFCAVAAAVWSLHWRCRSFPPKIYKYTDMHIVYWSLYSFHLFSGFHSAIRSNSCPWFWINLTLNLKIWPGRFAHLCLFDLMEQVHTRRVLRARAAACSFQL